jgi:hypothetical protein
MKSPEIITTCLAIYGAVLSTVAIVKQLVTDRVKVKLTVRRNMEMVGDPRYAGMELTMLEVTNTGRRPVTILGTGAARLYPTRHSVAADTRPALPYEISEGKYITAIIDQSDLDFSAIDYWQAWDCRGKIHKLSEASLVKHWKSKLQRRRALTKEKNGAS